MTTYRQTMSTALESVRIIQEGVILERQLSDTELKRREDIAQDLPDSDFKDRYGARWKEVKMAVATKQAKNESLEPKQEISEGPVGFSPAMLKKLKKAYSTLNRVDPTSPAGKKMPALLDKMDKDQLIQIVKADIKFLSLLAVNRLIRDHGMRADAIRKLKEDYEFGLNEAKYEIYHKDFSSAMQHAYKAAKKMYGITIDPKEIDDKVATGPKKPSSGKTNKYRLKGDKGGVQIQVYNMDNKKYELNMYKEEFVKEGYIELEFKDKRKAIQAFNYINNKIWAGGHPPYDDFNQEGSSLQIDTDGNLNRRNDMLKDLKALPRDLKFKVVVNEEVDLDEGTWKMPKSKKQIAPLLKLMRKPVKLGKDGDDAAKVVAPYIGDDELEDDLYAAG